MAKLKTLSLNPGRRPTLTVTLEDPEAGIPATEIEIQRLGAIAAEGITSTYQVALKQFLTGGWERNPDGTPSAPQAIMFADGSRVPVNEDALWLACVMERSQTETDPESRYEVSDFLRIGAASERCWKALTDALSEVAKAPKVRTAEQPSS